MGDKLTFVNFMKKITDRLAKIIFRQDVMGDVVGTLFVKLDVSKTLYFCCYTSSCFD